MSKENVEIVRRAFDTLRDSQPDELTDDALRGAFDPEVEWVPVPQGMLAGSRYHGYEGIRRFAADFFAAWDDLRVEPQDFRETDGRVVVVLRMQGQMHELDLDEIWSGLFTLHDGRVIRVQGFASPDGALEAAGLTE